MTEGDDGDPHLAIWDVFILFLAFCLSASSGRKSTKEQNAVPSFKLNLLIWRTCLDRFDDRITDLPEMSDWLRFVVVGKFPLDVPGSWHLWRAIRSIFSSLHSWTNLSGECLAKKEASCALSWVMSEFGCMICTFNHTHAINSRSGDFLRQLDLHIHPDQSWGDLQQRTKRWEPEMLNGPEIDKSSTHHIGEWALRS
jgi:hypothetical protein